MPPCAPTTCHSARQCVFLELKLDSRLAESEPQELGTLWSPSGPGSHMASAFLLPSQAEGHHGHLLSLRPLPRREGTSDPRGHSPFW